MNLNKAREYFSAYYEGTLDKGLSQSFERSLREDAQLQAEYKAFESTMTELSSLSLVEVELPDDLHEKISARLDRQIWESKQTQRGGIRQWFRIAAIGGLAAAVLGIAIFQSSRNDKAIEANPIPTLANQSKMEINPDAKGISFSYVTSQRRTIVIADQAGKELDRIVLPANEQIKNKPLQNPNQHATLLSITIGDEPPIWVALPGTGSSQFTPGTGTLKQFIQSLAEGYKTSVILNAGQVDREVTWEMGADLVATANKLTDSLKLKAELRQNSGSAESLLWIQEH